MYFFSFNIIAYKILWTISICSELLMYLLGFPCWQICYGVMTNMWVESTLFSCEPSNFPSNLFHPTTCLCQKSPLQPHFFLKTSYEFTFFSPSQWYCLIQLPLSPPVAPSSILYSHCYPPWTQNLTMAFHAQNLLITVVIILISWTFVTCTSLPVLCEFIQPVLTITL